MTDIDRRSGKQLPSPVTPATTVCFMIEIPNAVQYRAAFLGQLNILGEWHTWDHATDGTECVNCEEAAQLWRTAIYEAVWSDECGEDPMSCDDIADCIETDPAVRTAIGAIVPSVPIDGMTYPPGVPLTPSQMTTPLNEIDECAFDPFWAQCEQYIDYMVNLGQDVLEQIAAYSAALDAGEVVPMGQFLGKLKNSSTAGKVVEFLQWVVTVVKAQYEAANTEGNRITLKCAIFCENRDSCQITIEGTLNTLNDRLGGLLTPGDLTDLPTMVTAFTTAIFDPTLALDLWLLFLMGSAKTAGMFGMQGIDETINLVLAVAVNDANNDWVALCEDCDEPPPPDPNCMDLTEDPYDWQPSLGRAVYHTGQGWGPYTEPGLILLRVTRPSEAISRYISEVRVYFLEPQTNFSIFIGAEYAYSGSPVTEVVLNETTFPDGFPFSTGAPNAITIKGNGPIDGISSASQRIIMVCLVPA